MMGWDGAHPHDPSCPGHDAAGLRGRHLERSVEFYRRMGFREVKRGGFSHGGLWVWLRFPGSSSTVGAQLVPEDELVSRSPFL